MATIGTFSSTANGFKGSVKTLNLNVKTVTFSPADGDNEKGPDFRIFAGAGLGFPAALRHANLQDAYWRHRPPEPD